MGIPTVYALAISFVQIGYRFRVFGVSSCGMIILGLLLLLRMDKIDHNGAALFSFATLINVIVFGCSVLTLMPLPYFPLHSFMVGICTFIQAFTVFIAFFLPMRSMASE
jgi:hypothetical protein